MNVMYSLISLYPFQHHVDPAIGVYIIDRYTYYALEFLEKVDPESQRTIGEFVCCAPHYVMKVVTNLNSILI